MEHNDIREKHEEKYRQIGKKMAKNFADSINSMTFEQEIIEGFVEEMTKRTHRTLQQSSAKLIFALVNEWSNMYNDGHYDDRNKASLEKCNEIVRSIDLKSPLPFI